MHESTRSSENYLQGGCFSASTCGSWRLNSDHQYFYKLSHLTAPVALQTPKIQKQKSFLACWPFKITMGQSLNVSWELLCPSQVWRHLRVHGQGRAVSDRRISKGEKACWSQLQTTVRLSTVSKSALYPICQDSAHISHSQNLALTRLQFSPKQPQLSILIPQFKFKNQSGVLERQLRG